MNFDKEKKDKLLIISAIFFILGAIFLLGVYLFFEFFYASKFLPGIKIAGINIGGKDKELVSEELTSKVQGYLKFPVVFYSGDNSVEISKEDFKIDFNIDETLENSYKIGRSGNFFSQFVERLSLLFGGKSVGLVAEAGGIESQLEKLTEDFNVDGVNVGLVIENGKISETEASPGRKIREERLRQNIISQIENLKTEQIEIPLEKIYPSADLNKLDELKEEVSDFMESSILLTYGTDEWFIDSVKIGEWVSVDSRKYSLIKKDENAYDITHYLNNMTSAFGLMGFVEGELEASLKENKLNEYLKTLASEIDKEPENAKLSFENNKLLIVSSDLDGRKLNMDDARYKIAKALRDDEEKVELPVDTVQAKVREDNIDKLGIKKLISQGKSNFSNSSSARIHNVKTGASKFDGVLIAPGEEFSFNEQLGPVEASTGFLPELVIKPGKLVKEYGGGLCQVATTAFRAALYSGLPVTERKNHSFVVNHYFWPFTVAGTDATIYPPHPDLRFVNDTNNYILIQTYSVGQILYFDFYGDIGSRRATIEGPTVVSRGANGSLTTVFYRNVYNGDTLKRKDTFKSYYKPSSEFERSTTEDE